MGRELGLDAVDASILFFEDRSALALGRARREVEGEGMSLGMMSTYPDFTHPEARARAREIDAARETVDVAAALGMSYVRAIAGQAHPETALKAGIAWAVEGLRAMVEQSRGTGVEVVYENHDQAGVMDYPDFSACQEVFLRIYEATAALDLGINYDTGNATALTPDPLALLEAVLSRVRTLHVSDTSAIGEHIQPCVIGTGLAPLKALFGRLYEANWDGYVSIEEASGTGRAGIERAVGHVRELWRETR
jgi:sugar phosphate isomerase/epimerase